MSGLDFLSALHPSLAPGETIELRAKGTRTGEIVRRWHAEAAPLLADAARLSAAGSHVYVGAASRVGRASGDANCARAWALWAEVDRKAWAAEADPAACAAHAVESFGLRPSLLVDSGGGYHAYWLLAEAVNLQDSDQAARWREIGASLARALVPGVQPDMVGNPERVLRLPGTTNWKYPAPVRLVRREPDTRHNLEGVARWLGLHAPWALPLPEPELPRMAGAASGDAVIADFNARYDAVALLTAHGATVTKRHGHAIHLAKPGRTRDTHGTFGHYPGVLIVFSEDWPPFTPWRIPGQQRRGYDAFEIYSLLEHGGDRRAAYRAAVAAGYGTVAIGGLPARRGDAARSLRSLTRSGSQYSHNSHNRGTGAYFANNANSANPHRSL